MHAKVVMYIYGKNESSIRKILKTENIRSSFSVAPQTANKTSTIRDKLVIKLERALNLWIEYMNRKHIPINGNIVQRGP